MIEWTKIRKDVNDRIDLLELTCNDLEDGPVKDKIVEDLVVPALSQLGIFCACVEIEEPS